MEPNKVNNNSKLQIEIEKLRKENSDLRRKYSRLKRHLEKEKKEHNSVKSEKIKLSRLVKEKNDKIDKVASELRKTNSVLEHERDEVHEKYRKIKKEHNILLVLGISRSKQLKRLKTKLNIEQEKSIVQSAEILCLQSNLEELKTQLQKSEDDASSQYQDYIKAQKNLELSENQVAILIHKNISQQRIIDGQNLRIQDLNINVKCIEPTLEKNILLENKLQEANEKLDRQELLLKEAEEIMKVQQKVLNCRENVKSEIKEDLKRLEVLVYKKDEEIDKLLLFVEQVKVVSEYQERTDSFKINHLEGLEIHVRKSFVRMKSILGILKNGFKEYKSSNSVA